jgi:hypothetical protein
MPVLSLDIWEGLFVQDGVGTPWWRQSDQLPVVDDEFMTSWSLPHILLHSKVDNKYATYNFTLWNFCEHSVQQHRRFRRQNYCVVSLTEHIGQDSLQKTSPVAQRDKHQVFPLSSETVHPTVNLHSLVPVFLSYNRQWKSSFLVRKAILP